MSRQPGSMSYDDRLTPMPPLMSISIDDRIRFWGCYEKKGPDDCWPWNRPLRNFYGTIRLKGIYYRAHRVSYYFEYKIDPGKQLIRHSCDFKACVNPTHLLLGTHADNMNDAFKRGLMSRAGEKHPNVFLTESKVLEIRRIRGADEMTQAECAMEFGVTRQTIYRIENRILWRHI